MNRQRTGPFYGRTAKAVLVCSVLTLLGCSNALETGYVPRQLGTNATARRGYYASPFTAEAAAAAQAQTDPGADISSMRGPGGPGGGYRGR